MIFTETRLSGAFIVDLERHKDERGFFARVWCREEFRKHALATEMVQGNIAYNRKAGTLRGLHYQRSPHQEVKLVRCTRGAVYDVIVDLRPESSTYLEWVGIELTEENGRMLYVPEGLAHGYQTLADGSEVAYLVSEFYVPGSEAGIRFDDPEVGIEWPLPLPDRNIISDRDTSWPLLPPT